MIFTLVGGGAGCEPASGAAAAAVGPLLLGRAEDGIGTWRAEQQSKYLAVESSRSCRGPSPAEARGC